MFRALLAPLATLGLLAAAVPALAQSAVYPIVNDTPVSTANPMPVNCLTGCAGGGGGGGSVTQGTSPWVVGGDTAAGTTDAGNPVKVGGVYTTVLPTLANGQRGNLQLDPAGRLIISSGSGGSTVQVSGANGEAVAPAANPVRVAGWDGALLRTFKLDGSGVLASTVYMNGAVVTATAPLAVTLSPSSSSAYGITPVIAGSAASGQVLKASAGALFHAYAVSTAAGYLMIFNSSTVPADGATTAGTASGNLQDCIPIAANGQATIDYGIGQEENFSAGISAVVSSTGCATKTASATAFIHGSVK